MIKQFRSINPLNIVLLIFIAIFLRIGGLIHLPEEIPFEFKEPFSRLLLSIPDNNWISPVNNLLLAMIILIIQALFFNRIVNNYNLLGKQTYLPALLFVTIGSLLSPFLVLSPALICNFLILIIIERFLSIFKKTEVSTVMYDLGMIVALGALIYFPFIAMLPLIWIGLTIFRPFYWREWVATLLGFITIFFFLAVYYFWNDALDKFYQIWLPLGSKFPTRFNINFYDSLVLIPVVIILFLGFFHVQKNFFRSVVHLRKSFQLLFFMFILTLGSFYLKSTLVLYHFLLCVPSVAVLMAYYFLHAQRRWIYESLYILLVASLIYLQFI